GLATVGFNLIGQSFGPNSTLTVTRTTAAGGAMTFAAGGRALDLNGDGQFANTEGFQAGGDRTVLLGRHASRQSVVDAMQLIRVIQAGVDIDGDGQADLDGSRIYYIGTSAGAALGTMLTTVEPSVRAGVFAGTTGWPTPWLSVARNAVGTFLQNRSPSLINPAGAPVISSLSGIPLPIVGPFFNENIP